MLNVKYTVKYCRNMGCKGTKSKVYPEPEDYKYTNQTGLVTNSSNQADRPHES